MNPKLELEIGELSLDGFSNMGSKSLGSTIEIELIRLLKERGVPPNFLNERNAGQLDFGAFDFAANSGPKSIGRQIAKTIYSGFNHNSAHPPSVSKTQAKSNV